MQWLKIVEAGGDPQQEMDRRKMRARRAVAGQNGHEDNGDFDEDVARNGADTTNKYAEFFGDEEEQEDEDDDLDAERSDPSYGKHR